mmetsp:Transcript_49594/g.143879  ORF Transcript_49594/g.143879 Transcript_49594/m.143879 type:complete len:302 (+) Transcript_49594:443-1348(+)
MAGAGSGEVPKSVPGPYADGAARGGDGVGEYVADPRAERGGGRRDVEARCQRWTATPGAWRGSRLWPQHAGGRGLRRRRHAPGERHHLKHTQRLERDARDACAGVEPRPHRDDQRVRGGARPLDRQGPRALALDQPAVRGRAGHHGRHAAGRRRGLHHHDEAAALLPGAAGRLRPRVPLRAPLRVGGRPEDRRPPLPPRAAGARREDLPLRGGQARDAPKGGGGPRARDRAAALRGLGLQHRARPQDRRRRNRRQGLAAVLGGAGGPWRCGGALASVRALGGPSAGKAARRPCGGDPFESR